MDLLIPSTGLLFWMSITFLVVLFILWKWGFPVITDMVKERQAFINDSLQKAHAGCNQHVSWSYSYLKA